MTVIIGIEDPDNGRVIMFADSGIFHADHGAVLSTPKIWRDGDWIVGMAGSWKDSRLLRQTKLPMLALDASELEVADAVAEWNERAVQRTGELHTTIRAADNTAALDTPSILVARNSLLFDVEDCAVMRTGDGWQSAGMWTYASGALSALDAIEGLTQFERGARAMKAVERVTINVICPVRWLATDGTEGVL